MGKAVLKEVMKYTFIAIVGFAGGKYSYNLIGHLMGKTPGVNW